MKRIFALVLTLALAAALAAPALAAEFTDVPASHTFHDAVAACSASGIVGGYSDGTFRPANTLSKNHFCAMLARAFFPETIVLYDTDQYRALGSFAPTSYALAHHSVLDGTSFHWYFTDSSVMTAGINRYDMAQLLANILKAKGVSASEAEKSAAAAQIADYGAIPADYRDAVASAAAKGLIGGYSDGNFHGDRTMNRGQAAVVIYRLQSLVPAQSGTPVETPDPEPAQEPDPAPSQTPADVAAGFLTNGKPITEENVTEILDQLKERYPRKTDFSKGYAGLGSGRSSGKNCIEQITSQYWRAENHSQHTSTTSGCGGWAAFVADELFGQTNVTWKKTTIENARPGDLIIDLDTDGYLTHVFIYVSESTDGFPKTQEVYGTHATSNSSGVYHIGWANGNGHVNYGDAYDGHYGGCDVYTAYPD